MDELKVPETVYTCPCCGDELIDALMATATGMLVDMMPDVIISSGYRCKKHNASLKKAAPNSAHLRARAIDIECTKDECRYKLISNLQMLGFIRIYIYKGMFMQILILHCHILG